MKKILYLLLILSINLDVIAQESNLLGVYVNEIAIKYADSLSYYTKVFVIKGIVNKKPIR